MDEYSSKTMKESPDGGARPLADNSSALGYDEPTMKGDVYGAAPTADADDGYDEPTMREAPPRPIGPRVGDRLVGGRYEVLSELGRGGMGVVYRCLDGVSGIEVALKALPPEVAHNREEMEDVRDNFQLVSRLVHQNIAAVRNLEKGDSIGDYYIVMELVTGENLRQWMRRTRREKGEITIDDAMPILRQVAEALDYAHGKKVMHRDVKPGNIMLSSDGQAKVMDFGLAAQIHSSLSHVSLAYHGTSGTQSYMAPEQWRGKAQGAAADQYALAVMAYEMLSGHLPFDAVDADVLKKAVLEETADPIDGLPESSNRALQRALSKNAADRFPTCGEFVDALSGAKASASSSGALRWCLAALLVAVAILCSYKYFNYRNFEKKRIEAVTIELQKRREAGAKAAEIKAAEEKRLQEAEKAAEEKRLQEEAARKAAEEKRLQEEAARKAAEEKQLKAEVYRLWGILKKTKPAIDANKYD
ncbi:MAG: serine/threonine protein kinase, partial [Oscillospiraceae bacterium]|nr:serine/threonine protein kinase [Oscillospiraceae bacterium]